MKIHLKKTNFCKEAVSNILWHTLTQTQRIATNRKAALKIILIFFAVVYSKSTG